MTSIFEKIQSEVDDFIYNDIEVVPGYNFNQYETIKRVHLYLNSEFYEATEYNGRPLIFFQISTPRKDAVVRFLDIDTKDIRLFELNPDSEIAISLLQKELQLWMKNNDFGQVLNQLADELASFGSVVLKKNKNGMPEIIDLRRLFIDPTVERIQDSRFITIKHYFTDSELRGMVKQGWDANAIERIIRATKQTKTDNAEDSYEKDARLNVIRSANYIEVYERYGLVEKGMIEGGNSEKEVRSLMVVAEPNLKSEEGAEMGEILFKSKWNKDYPFTDFHFTKTRGRWLGIGVMEALFPAQERVNELANQRRIHLELAMLQLFQTADPTVFNNVLNDLLSGDVIKTKTQNSLQRVDNGANNLPALQNEQEDYRILADTVSHANDVLRGGQIPSSTPATNAVLANNNAASVQLWKRENFALMVRDFINEFVIPQLVQELKEEHVLRFTGDTDELAKLDEHITEIALVKEAKEKTLSLEVITPFILEGIEKEVRIRLKKEGNKRYIKVLKDYYTSKIEDGFGLDINIDNEQEDLATVAQNTFAFAQLYASNPQFLDDPVGKELMLGWGRKIGIDTGKLELAFGRRETLQGMEGVKITDVETGELAPELIQ